MQRWIAITFKARITRHTYPQKKWRWLAYAPNLWRVVVGKTWGYGKLNTWLNTFSRTGRWALDSVGRLDFNVKAANPLTIRINASFIWIAFFSSIKATNKWRLSITLVRQKKLEQLRSWYKRKQLKQVKKWRHPIGKRQLLCKAVQILLLRRVNWRKPIAKPLRMHWVPLCYTLYMS